MHYYHQRNESAGRSGNGGQMNPYETLLLRQHVNEAWENHKNDTLTNRTDKPTVGIRKQEEDEFFKKYASVIEKVRTVKDAKGRYLYFPWREKSYVYPTTTDNILKMWNTIQEAWKMISSHAKKNKIKYTRAAMLRIDVTYVTPVDIWDNGTAGIRDVDNNQAVIPGFGRYPVRSLQMKQRKITDHCQRLSFCTKSDFSR
jgi:ribosome modulation factor